MPVFIFVNLMPAHSPYHATPASWSQARVPALRQPDEWLDPYVTADRPGVDLQVRAPGQQRTGIQRFLAGDLDIPPEGWELLGDLYDGEVTEADWRMHRIVEAWTAARPDGIVAVASDHGEALGEQGLVDHRGNVYPAVTRVPLAIAAPGRLEAGCRVDHAVDLTGLGETLLAVAGEGRGPLFAPRAAPIRAAAWPDPYRAEHVGGRWERTWYLFREGDEALVFNDRGEGELYDLETDPGMLSPREDPERTRALLAEARASFAEAESGDPLEMSQELRQRLAELGYVE